MQSQTQSFLEEYDQLDDVGEVELNRRPRVSFNRDYIAQKMRYLFKRTLDKGVCCALFKFITVPLVFVRDYTCPMAEQEAWNRTRATILPVTMPFAFFLLTGKFDFFSDHPDDIEQNKLYGLITAIALVPGIIVAVLIRTQTKKTRGPRLLISAYAILSFVMSIAWISFTSDSIIDLLRLFGFITSLPRPLLALTILAWGNCLGDMSADLAMTKKGFGEMAITGTMAGPIFNILMGQGLAMIIKLINSGDPLNAHVRLSIYKATEPGAAARATEFDPESLLPLVLISAQLVTLIFLLLNALRNHYSLSSKFGFINSAIYVGVLLFLVSYSIYVAYSGRHGLDLEAQFGPGATAEHPN